MRNNLALSATQGLWHQGKSMEDKDNDLDRRLETKEERIKRQQAQLAKETKTVKVLP